MSKKQNPKDPKANAPEARESIELDEASRLLTSFASFLRQDTGTDELAEMADSAANTSRFHISGPAEAQGKGAEEAYPSWAKDKPNLDKIFVKHKHEIDLWQPVAEPVGKDKQEIAVNYRRLNDELRPAGKKEEQGIELEAVNNHFTLDEWNHVAQPILKRYTKALELKALARLTEKTKEETEKRIRSLIPQVFRAKEIMESDQVDVTSREFKQKIIGLVNEISINPDILKNWIMEELGESETTPIQKSTHPLGKSVVVAYASTQKDAGLKRIKQRFQKKGEDETIESYVQDLADRISKVGGQLLYLNVKHPEGVYEPPKTRKDFVESPHMQRVLEQFSEKVSRQLEDQKGMVSMIGDMGTGKNYLVEEFSAKTQRPFFYFPCARGMDAADLGFHFEFRKGESLVVPSNLAKGLKTKNSLILIDEPNALPPEVVAALHGLADHNRSCVYNGVKFEAEEGVVIIMTMNPATYAHVKDLPEAFADRTLGQDLYLDYPPLTKLDELAQEHLWSNAEREKALQEDNELNKYFLCDEALILRNEFPALKGWSDEEFTHLWNAVANGEGTAPLGNRADEMEKLEPMVKAILSILKVCNAWRAKYKAGDMQRTISLRGSSAVAANYLRVHDVRKAFLDLYKPHSKKYDGGGEDYESPAF